jgi:transcriptional antiterminator RfaH
MTIHPTRPEPSPAEDSQGAAPAWFVAHTRPRCEKKLQEFCERAGFEVSLPVVRSVKTYQSKKVAFTKPLFPGYVFVKLRPSERQSVYQSDHVANLLNVVDQAEFEAQLKAILEALETDLEVCALPHIAEGKKVRITNGPLRGMEGVVHERQGVFMVVLRLDFIAQSAGVRVNAAELELAE